MVFLLRLKPDHTKDCLRKISVIITIPVKHIHTGQQIEVANKTALHLESLTEQMFFSHVEMRLKGLIIHELEECFFVDGKPYFDPHSEERRSSFKRVV